MPISVGSAFGSLPEFSALWVTEVDAAVLLSVSVRRDVFAI